LRTRSRTPLVVSPLPCSHNLLPQYCDLGCDQSESYRWDVVDSSAGQRSSISRTRRIGDCGIPALRGSATICSRWRSGGWSAANHCSANCFSGAAWIQRGLCANRAPSRAPLSKRRHPSRHQAAGCYAKSSHRREQHDELFTLVFQHVARRGRLREIPPGHCSSHYVPT
jgi:hypothetical protein